MALWNNLIWKVDTDNNKMKNISNKEWWILGAIQVQVEPSTMILIKYDIERKLEKDYIKIKLCRNTAWATLDVY